jgi:hypothetical protein
MKYDPVGACCAARATAVADPAPLRRDDQDVSSDAKGR